MLKLPYWLVVLLTDLFLSIGRWCGSSLLSQGPLPMHCTDKRHHLAPTASVTFQQKPYAVFSFFLKKLQASVSLVTEYKRQGSRVESLCHLAA